MPVALTAPVTRWLRRLALISGERQLPGGAFELSFNDQLYLQNGYLIGQLLRVLLREGGGGEALLRIRKIAHISSNQNWRILIDVLTDLGFKEEVDLHAVSLQHLQDILQFLWEKFGDAPAVPKRMKKTCVDLGCFQGGQPPQTADNLLEFMVLALQQAFSLTVGQSIGLLIDNGRYLKQVLIAGTADGHKQVVQLYQLILRTVPALNQLLSEQYGGEDRFLGLLGMGVLSESQAVCQLCCAMLANLDSEWVSSKGVDILMRSPHACALDLLFHRLGGRISEVFNPELHRRFNGKTSVELRTYSRLVRYFHQSLFGREILKSLQISYYISRAFGLFQPDQRGRYGGRERTAARYLLATATRYFQKTLTFIDHSQVLYCFDISVTETEEERIAALSIVFDVLGDIFEKQRSFGFKLLGVAWKYRSLGSQEMKTLVSDNLLFLFKSNPANFPIAHFLHLFEPTGTLQSCEFGLLLCLSELRQLTQQLGEMLLRIATVYYYQQLCAGGAVEIIKNIVRGQAQVGWAREVSQEILGKWTSLQIPPYQPVPTHSKKIKFRSVGLKKAEMIQFTELNRYKSLLLILLQIADRKFLTAYAKNVASTIPKVQKSKTRQVQNTKVWLKNLLSLIEARLCEIKDTPFNNLALDESESMLGISEVHPVDELRPKLSPYIDSRIGKILQESENQFMTQPQIRIPSVGHELSGNQIVEMSPLLPFSEQQIQHLPLFFQELYFQNYEHTFVKNLNQKYSALLQLLTNKYKSVLGLQHFFTNAGVMPYVKNHVPMLLQLERTLSISEDNPQKRLSKLILQAALFAFEFKLTRRVSVKCVQSFYDLLTEKNPINSGAASVAATPIIQSKMEFDPHIIPPINKWNRKISNYTACFEIISEIMQQNLGVALVQPVSKMVTNVTALSPLKQSKLVQEQQRVTEDELNELQNLERIIQSESQVIKSRVITDNFRSTPMLKKKEVVIAHQPTNQKQMTERWTELQKKVVMRRKQLEGRALQSNK